MPNLSLLSEPTTFVCHEWNGHQIRQRRDGWVCLTDMAKASGKLVADYLRLSSTKAYLERLSDSMGIPIESLLTAQMGKNNGTFSHPEVAIDFAHWADLDFRIWANQTLREVIAEGKSSDSGLGSTPSVAENQIPTYQAPVTLPSTEQRLAALIDVLERAKSIGFNPSDPRSAHGVNEQVARILLSDSPVSPANTVNSVDSRPEPMPLIVNLEKHMSARELAKIWTGRGGRTLAKRANYVNRRLRRSGFQWRNTISGLWIPTEKAAPYVKVAGGELLWLPTVLSNFRLNARTTQRK